MIRPLRAYGDNARPARALPEAPNRYRVNEGQSPRRVLKHTPRSWFEAKIDVRWSLDFMHDQLACGRFRIVNI